MKNAQSDARKTWHQADIPGPDERGILRVDKCPWRSQSEWVTPQEAVNRWTRAARIMTRVLPLLLKHLWVGPLLGLLVLGIVGFWTRSRLEGTTRAELASRLETVLQADIAALRLWFTEREYDAKTFASDPRIQGAIEALAILAREPGTTPAMLTNSSSARRLQEELQPLAEVQHYLDYVVFSPEKRILASPRPRQVGLAAPPAYGLFLTKALRGELSASRPFAHETTPSQHAEGPTMFVAAPVKSTNGAVVAVLGLRMRPEKEFSRIFSVARMGETGEAYAFDRRGMMLTATRFDPMLKTLGLIPPGQNNTAIFNLKLLDPEHRLYPGEPPAKPRDQLVLTRMAASATMGNNGCDVKGYRNYSGVPVVGAWAWLRDFGMGVATEVSVDEAFRPLYVLRQAFLVLFGLLVLSGGAIFGFTLMVERLQAAARSSSIAARRLGQYVLVQEIGRGANGSVYRGRHSLLRRPVAIKLLSPEITNNETVARFEHEVQMTSQLTHPNTVAIYDYGRTPEGLFYYAMEFLSGINLDQLVRNFGPQPEGRVIHILRQVCGSLAEAHRTGLIHRDIKPANIILTRRGGACDMVKVLDFGLVKTANSEAAHQTGANQVVGTPHFMPPEAIQKPESVDDRSDIYSLGAVGYWLLTGKALFETDSMDVLLARQVHEQPPSPSERLGQLVSADLEALIMQCLAKRPEQRPPSAEALEAALGHCVSAGRWTTESAENWWRLHGVSAVLAPEATMLEKTLVIAPRT